MTDRLSLTNALADAIIDRQKAERIATGSSTRIHDNVPPKPTSPPCERTCSNSKVRWPQRSTSSSIGF